jgi:hypothetical protein
MTMNEQKEILEKAIEDMCKSLNSYGTDEILKLLVRFSNQDRIINELLLIYPTTVAMAEVFYNKPVYKIDEKTFQNLVDANPDIWVRKEIEGQKEDQKTSSQILQKRKITKSKKGKASATVEVLNTQ